MAEDDTIEDDTIEEGVLDELVQKLTPCIERGELDACVEEAARLAGEVGIGASALLGLATKMGIAGKYEFAYVLSLVAVGGLDGPEKATAHSNTGLAAQSLGNVGKAEAHYLIAIGIDPESVVAHSNYANLLNDIGKKGGAAAHYLKAIEIDPEFVAAHSNYANLLNDLGDKGDAETHYIKTLEIDPESAVAHSNYANLLNDIGKKDDAVAHYLKAIELDPKYAVAYSNYANLLNDVGKKDDAAAHYLKAIEIDPKYAAAHSNYALLLNELDKKHDAEAHYLKAIELDPNYATAHYNYAILLNELGKKHDAEMHYLKAFELDSKHATTHYNYALLLNELDRKHGAETYYLKAIELDPNYAEVHGAYGHLLIDYDKRNEALSETESASALFKETGRITQSYLAKAWFYQKYSEKYFNQKEYRKSSDDADKASDEYFKAAETAEGDLIDNLTLQGNVLKAKSFMRKIPSKPWYNKIYKLLGTKPDISELVRNLQDAAKWYQNASACEVDGKKDVCDACHLSINVFSEVLDAMSAFVKGNNAEINKDKWLSSLDTAREIYANKELNKGAALVDSLRQLVTCVDELAKHKVSGLKPQADRLGECYNSLLEVNRRLEGALQIIADNATEAIRDYAKKEGLGFIEADGADNKFFHRTFNAIKDIGFWVVIGLIIWVLSYYILPPYLDSLFNY